MKFVHTIFVVVSLATEVLLADVNPKNEAERRILQFFQRWRTGETQPFTLPPLDVIIIPPLNGSYSGKGVKITFSSSEMQLHGVNNFSVEELSVTLPAMRASGLLSIPTLTITAGTYFMANYYAVKEKKLKTICLIFFQNLDCYDLQGKAFYVYKLKGSGKLDVTLDNIKLQFNIRLGRIGNGTRVIEMQLDFGIQNIQANLQNSSWPVNKLLNKEGIKILNGYREDIVTATRTNLVGTFNNYLVGVTPAQLLNKIQV